MDRYVSEIIEGIYASMEGDVDVALVARVLDEVRREAAAEEREACAKACEDCNVMAGAYSLRCDGRMCADLIRARGGSGGV